MKLPYKNQTENIPFYRDTYEHLEDELKKLDLLLTLRIIAHRLRNQQRKESTGSHPLYISHNEVDWLLEHRGSLTTDHPALDEIRREFEAFHRHITAKVEQSMEQGVCLALPQLARLFSLSPFEMQAVLICCAPELDRSYDTLYAYMQDDITRKKPSIDLVLNLLCESPADRWKSRHLLSGHAPLRRAEIVHCIDDPQSPSGSSDLARFLKLDARILGFLLGNRGIDERLIDLVHLYEPSCSVEDVLIDPLIKTELIALTKSHCTQEKSNYKKLTVYFHGPFGVGKRECALALCNELRCPLLYLDMAMLHDHRHNSENLLRLTFREGVLQQAAVYLDNMDLFLNNEVMATAHLKKLDMLIAEYGWVTFCAGETPWQTRWVFTESRFHQIEIPLPNIHVRTSLWTKELQAFGKEADKKWAAQLAQSFTLSQEQIREAVKWAKNKRAMREGGEIMTLSDLYAACRTQSNQKLRELAVKIEPRYGWEDIVLPDKKIMQLKEICSQVRHRSRVLDEWGFEHKLSHGKGLSVLFSGPPGTGKTMAAEVIAHDLQLDLYKIDLSGVVSKYIGETEKNLSKIFQEAETSNAILFFDEADALFGKRTGVSDAHDRYANVETSYLLQKMEEYRGTVILATNLRENMDEAFTRRIRCIVEFPFPDEASRLRIWKTHFPHETPVSDSIDYAFISKQFSITGGSIKNIVLNSAFLAADDGGIIRIEHIMHGMKREFEKIGKLWDEKHLFKACN